MTPDSEAAVARPATAAETSPSAEHRLDDTVPPAQVERARLVLSALHQGLPRMDRRRRLRARRDRTVRAPGAPCSYLLSAREVVAEARRLHSGGWLDWEIAERLERPA